MPTKSNTGFTTNVGPPRDGRIHMTGLFNDNTETGDYYFHPTGCLYRVPTDSISLWHSPLMNICSSDECFVTKVSDDPWIPLNKARELCSNWDFCVNF